MKIKTRNASKRWTAKQEKIAGILWLRLSIRCFIIGKSELAIANRLYKLNRKNRSFREGEDSE